MDENLVEILRSVGLDSESVQTVFARPQSERSDCYTATEWLHHNTVYGVLLQPGQSVGQWVTQHLGMHGRPLSSDDAVVVTPLLDKHQCLDGCQTVLYLNSVASITALISKSTTFASVVCIGPVQALRDDDNLTVAQIVERILGFCSPSYSRRVRLPPVILFTDGDAEDKHDIPLLRQYACMLKS